LSSCAAVAVAPTLSKVMPAQKVPAGMSICPAARVVKNVLTELAPTAMGLKVNPTLPGGDAPL